MVVKNRDAIVQQERLTAVMVRQSVEWPVE